MYTGHFGVALVAAGGSRRIPLWLLITAAFGSDLLEGVVAIPHVQDPTRVWSHSLPMTAALGAVLALGWKLAGGTWRECVTVCLVTMSHVVLDLVTAEKTFWPGADPVGLNLYQYPLADTIVEALVCVAGWRIWRASLTPDRRQSAVAWSPLVVLLGVQGLAYAHLLIFGSTPDPDALSKFIR